MEERLPPPGLTKDPPPPPPLSPLPAVDLDIYVVQVLRDQIYRFPPPEHARIVERDLNRDSSSPARTCRKTLCWAAAASIFVIVAAVTAVFAIRATLYNPSPPEFSVARIQARNLDNTSKVWPEIDVILRAENPNVRLSVSYQGGSGEASLIYKNQKIGKGKIRSTIKQEPRGRAVDIPVMWVGNGTALSAEIKKILNNGSAEKSMAIKIEVAVEMNSWVRNEQKNVKISCDFKVKNSLMRNNKILFQECTTEFSTQDGF